MKQLLFILACISYQQFAFAQDAELVLPQFIKDHPKKSAICLIYNDSIVVEINSVKKFPLASTAKIVVALEYATQVAKGEMVANEQISISELEKYYIPNTDGNAHPMWLNLMKTQKKIIDDKVSIEEVVKGMINFSSNANTAYMMDRLTLVAINSQIEKLGLMNHDPMYHWVAALGVINGKTTEELEAIDMPKYRALCVVEHEKMKKNKDYRKTFTQLPFDVQRVWSDRLPASTVQDYVSIMKKINSRTYFDKDTQKNIDLVMEGILTNPANRKLLKHAGMKGGSTMWVLTKALYATKTDGEKIEMAYFFNDLTIPEFTQIRKYMNKFELGVIANRNSEREKVISLLNE